MTHVKESPTLHGLGCQEGQAGGLCMCKPSHRQVSNRAKRMYLCVHTCRGWRMFEAQVTNGEGISSSFSKWSVRRTRVP